MHTHPHLSILNHVGLHAHTYTPTSIQPLTHTHTPPQERSYVGRQPSHLRLGLRERGVRRFAEMVFSTSGCVLDDCFSFVVVAVVEVAWAPFFLFQNKKNI